MTVGGRGKGFGILLMVVQTSAVLRILFGRNAGWGAQRRIFVRAAMALQPRLSVVDHGGGSILTSCCRHTVDSKGVLYAASDFTGDYREVEGGKPISARRVLHVYCLGERGKYSQRDRPKHGSKARRDIAKASTSSCL